MVNHSVSLRRFGVHSKKVLSYARLTSCAREATLDSVTTINDASSIKRSQAARRRSSLNSAVALTTEYEGVYTENEFSICLLWEEQTLNRRA